MEYAGKESEFPFMVVLVSGGHSQILVCHDYERYQLLGGTLDDSLGEALDKCARLLGLAYSEGGRGLEQLAKLGDSKVYRFPRLMPKTLDLSFSGLKSSTGRLVENLLMEKKLDLKARCNLAAAFQYTAFEHLTSKVRKSILNVSETLNSIVSPYQF
jgi:N6-L-threonylcarbamoyladenine synthase